MPPSQGRATAPALSLLTRLRLWLSLRLLKAIMPLARVFMRRRQVPLGRPTYCKTYAVHPHDECRVFIPSSYVAGQAKLLPLFIDIHGGGYCIGRPESDDNDNVILSEKHGICVVSIPYRKAPGHPFPTAQHDAANLIRAVLDDNSLPVDKSRVAVGGYSAGGGLSLTAVQLHGLHERIKGVVAFYPVTDWTLSLAEKEGRATVAPGRKADLLHPLYPLFEWGYIAVGQNLREPLLSPLYAAREKLPAKLAFYGCGYDILCPEAKEMAERLADHQSVADQPKTEQENGWERGGIKWEHLPGLEHGFNQLPKGALKEAAIMRKRQEEMLSSAADWLYREVYSG